MNDHPTVRLYCAEEELFSFSARGYGAGTQIPTFVGYRKKNTNLQKFTCALGNRQNIFEC